MSDSVLSIDTETKLILPGQKAPPPMCLTWHDPGTNESGIIDRRDLIGFAEDLFVSNRRMSGANIAYDNIVLVAEGYRYGQKLGQHMMNLVINKYQRGEIRCTIASEKLLDIENGTFSTGKDKSYGLDAMVGRYYDWNTAKLLGDAKGKSVKKFTEDEFLYQLWWYMELLVARDTGSSHPHYGAIAEIPQRLQWLETFIGKPYNEIPWRLRFGQLEARKLTDWPDEPVRYAIDDTVWDSRVGRKIEERARAINYWDPVFPWQVHEAPKRAFLDFCLTLRGAHGFRTDPVQIAKAKGPFLAGIEDLEKELEKIGLLSSPRTSGEYKGRRKRETAALRLMVSEAYNGAPPMTEPQKNRKSTKPFVPQVQTGAEVLEKSGNEALVQFAKWDEKSRMCNQWFPIVEAGVSHPVHTNIGCILETGRTHSFKFNSQNPTKVYGYRQCFIPRPGYAIMSADYSAIELCALAQICLWWFGHSRLAQCLIDGRDPHCLTGAYILDEDYDTFMQKYKYEKTFLKPSDHRPHVDARQIAKALNFGLPGGLGAERFVNYAKDTWDVLLVELSPGVIDFEKSVIRAKKLKKIFLGIYPEIRLYMNKISGMIPDFDPKVFQAVQFVSNRKRGGTGYTDGCNGYYQALAADGGTDAVIQLDIERYFMPPQGVPSPLYGSRGLTWIHDEDLSEVPLDRVHPIGKRVQEVMLGNMQNYIRDVPVECKPAAALCWDKDMEEVFDDNGELTLWYPGVLKQIKETGVKPRPAVEYLNDLRKAA